MTICSAPECSNAHAAKGLCGMHYARFKRHGSYDLPKVVSRKKVVEKKHLTQEMLLERIHYDPKTGIFTWRHGNGTNVKAGDVAGCIINAPISRGGPRWKIKLYYRHYVAHRLAYLYMTGKWPPKYVDHIDGDGLNNKWENLRAATAQQNCANSRSHKKSKSGIKGVIKRDRNSYEASIKHNGKSIYIGRFGTAEQAKDAYNAKNFDLNGEFACFD